MHIDPTEDLQLWAPGSSKRALTAHIVVADGEDGAALRHRLNQMLDEAFEIEHTTLQLESGNCDSHACDNTHP